jgi:hypothetical protein
MTTDARALGAQFDLMQVVAVSDLAAGASTGNRVHLRNASGVTFVVMKDAASTDDLAVDLREHTAATGGTSQDLDIITTFFVKEETTLDGDEQWTRVTQAAASEIAARADSAEKETLWAIEVRADQLSDGFEWVSLDVPDLGATGAQFGAVLAILWNLNVQRAPELLPAPSV